MTQKKSGEKEQGCYKGRIGGKPFHLLDPARLYTYCAYALSCFSVGARTLLALLPLLLLLITYGLRT